MKISELNSKTFLGGQGAAGKSYVLINYEDDSTSAPVTYKATIDELGKSIVNNLHLYKETANGAVTTSVDNGAYVDGAAKQFVTAAEKAKIAAAASTGAITAATSGLASTGYVTSAVNAGKQGLASTGYVTAAVNTGKQGLASTGAVTAAVTGLASTGAVTAAVSGLASTGYVTAAVNGLASTGYVTNAISTLPSQGDLANFMTASNIQAAATGLASTGYVTSAVANINEFDPTASISCSVTIDGTTTNMNLYPIMGDCSSLYIRSNNNDYMPLTPFPSWTDISGLASEGYVDSAIAGLASFNDLNGLASENYVDNAVEMYVSTAMNDRPYLSTSDGITKLMYGINGSHVTYNMVSGAASTGALAAKASTGAVTAAVNGLASTGYVTNAVSGLASTGYVTNAVNNCITENDLPQIIGNTIDIEDSSSDLHSGFIVLSDNGKLSIVDNTTGGYYAAIQNIAYIDTSDNKPCIRDYDGTFQGFLSAT